MTFKSPILGSVLALACTAAAHGADLSVRTLSGGPFELTAHKGHVVLVNFWATWCPPCREEIPALNGFYRKYHGQGLDIIGVSADAGRDLEAVQKMAPAIAYPVAMLREASANSFGSPRGLPVTFVINRQGEVVAELRPDSMPITAQSLEAQVGPLLRAR